MPQRDKTKKAIFQGSLARRAFLICLALLIIPLFIHSFLLYTKEVRLQEATIQTDLKAIGALLQERLQKSIETTWQLLEARSDSLSFEAIDTSPDAPTRFVKKNDDSLLVGVKLSDTNAIAAQLLLAPLLTLPEPASFPIDVSLQSSQELDQWQLTFPIAQTSLLLTVATSSQKISDLQLSHLLFRIGSFLFFVAILGGSAVYFLLRKTYRPLNALRLTMERVAEGAIHSRYTPHRFGFELNAIGQSFNDTLDAVLLHQKEAEKEKIAKETLAQELKLGWQIQQDLLPQIFPAISYLDVGAGCLPAKEVGGDFYDVFALSSKKCLIVVADLAGKGISACLFSLGLRSSLRALATMTDDLAQIVNRANELFLLDAKESGQFATLWIGLLQPNELHYISLGHPPVYLQRKEMLFELSTHHPAVGLMPLFKLTTAVQPVEKGDTLLLYSDGATEAHNASLELYGSMRLKAVFSRISGVNAKEDVELILQDIQRFSQGSPQSDDLTLLLIRVLGNQK